MSVDLVVRIAAGLDIREAVRNFNDSPISQSAVDTLRDRMLAIADYLAPPPVDMDAAADAELAARVGLRVVGQEDR